MLSLKETNDAQAGRDNARLSEEFLLPEIGGGSVLRAQDLLPEPVGYAREQYRYFRSSPSLIPGKSPTAMNVRAITA